jgi:hypothetical protein
MLGILALARKFRLSRLLDGCLFGFANRVFQAFGLVVLPLAQ